METPVLTPSEHIFSREFLRVGERLAVSAGLAILAIKDGGIEVSDKPDSSPVTAADHTAEEIILNGLKSAFPDLPVVAEEEAAAGRIPDISGGLFAIVDPLDGTREFVSENPDYTVNIALVSFGQPVAGIVYAPEHGVLYSGCDGEALVCAVKPDGEAGEQRKVSCQFLHQKPRIVASRSHRTPETDQFISSHGGAGECISVGSSLKFCLLAAGEADLYPRFGPTMEWDTAAGDAVLRAAGGMTSTIDGKPLMYGKRNQHALKDFANPDFIARAMRPS